MKTQKIAIFASGSGTNAENIAEYFSGSPEKAVTLILSNNKNAGVFGRAERLNIPSVLFSKDEFYQSQNVLDILKQEKIDLIVLAGFLWLIPDYLISNFSGKIINIHPALLPKYGGKGMFGMKVHESVLYNKESESGITIHFVNEKYDDGEVILQVRCNVDPDDTPESLANKIHALEYEFFPKAIDKLLADPGA